MQEKFDAALECLKKYGQEHLINNFEKLYLWLLNMDCNKTSWDAYSEDSSEEETKQNESPLII